MSLAAPCSVMLSPRPNVADVLARTQIDQLIPVFGELGAARAGLGGERSSTGQSEQAEK